MSDLIERLPKAELHVHLEGTVEPGLLWRLAERYRSPLFSEGRAALDRLYATEKFHDFLMAFKTVCQHLRAPEDYELAAYEALRRLAAQNVRYAELTLSAGVVRWKGENLRAQFEGAVDGARRAREEFGIESAWIFDAVRQFGAEKADEVVREAAMLRDMGVVGFGLGGDEVAGPPEMFERTFEIAASEGLRLTVHAGEAAGPESIWKSVKLLKAHRIGHGVTAHQDPELVEYLAANAIPLEICVTSNLRTGSVTALERHPLRHYFERGVPLSLNTDDPALFGASINREYGIARRVFGFSDRNLIEVAKASFRSSFLPPHRKEEFLREFDVFDRF